MAAKRVKTGQMRERIEFLSVADAPFGTHSLERTTAVVTTRWARVIEYTIASRANRGIAENITHRFEVREGSDVEAIDNTNRIQWRGKIYKIEHKTPMGAERGDPRQQFLGFDCEYQGTADAYTDPSPETT